MSAIRFDVDAVFCISLDTRADRRTLFSETIGRQLDNEVHFHVVEKNSDPKRGCYESHQQLARHALDNGLDRVLIFEDDAKAYEFKPSQVRWVNRFMQKRPFEALHLSLIHI